MRTHGNDVEVRPTETRVAHLDDDIVRGGDDGDGNSLQTELAFTGITLQRLHPGAGDDKLQAGRGRDCKQSKLEIK